MLNMQHLQDLQNRTYQTKPTNQAYQTRQTNTDLFLLISSFCDHWMYDVKEVAWLEKRLRDCLN